MSDIRVPKLSNNDTEYVLVEWAVEDGKPVRSGDPVATVETSKAAEELVAEADGYIRHLVKAGAFVAPGQPIATLSSGPPQPPPDPQTTKGSAPRRGRRHRHSPRASAAWTSSASPLPAPTSSESGSCAEPTWKRSPARRGPSRCPGSSRP